MSQSMCDIRSCSLMRQPCQLANFPPADKPSIRAQWWEALYDRLNFDLTASSATRVRVCDQHFTRKTCVPCVRLGPRLHSPPPVPSELVRESESLLRVRTYSRRPTAIVTKFRPIAPAVHRAPTCSTALRLAPTGPTAVRLAPAGSTTVRLAPTGPAAVRLAPTGSAAVRLAHVDPAAVRLAPTGRAAVTLTPTGPTAVRLAPANHCSVRLAPVNSDVARPAVRIAPTPTAVGVALSASSVVPLVPPARGTVRLAPGGSSGGGVWMAGATVSRTMRIAPREAPAAVPLVLLSSQHSSVTSGPRTPSLPGSVRPAAPTRRVVPIAPAPRSTKPALTVSVSSMCRPSKRRSEVTSDAPVRAKRHHAAPDRGAAELTPPEQGAAEVGWDGDSIKDEPDEVEPSLLIVTTETVEADQSRVKSLHEDEHDSQASFQSTFSLNGKHEVGGLAESRTSFQSYTNLDGNQEVGGLEEPRASFQSYTNLDGNQEVDGLEESRVSLQCSSSLDGKREVEELEESPSSLECSSNPDGTPEVEVLEECRPADDPVSSVRLKPLSQLLPGESAPLLREKPVAMWGARGAESVRVLTPPSISLDASNSHVLSEADLLLSTLNSRQNRKLPTEVVPPPDAVQTDPESVSVSPAVIESVDHNSEEQDTFLRSGVATDSVIAGEHREGVGSFSPGSAGCGRSEGPLSAALESVFTDKVQWERWSVCRRLLHARSDHETLMLLVERFLLSSGADAVDATTDSSSVRNAINVPHGLSILPVSCRQGGATNGIQDGLVDIRCPVSIEPVQERPLPVSLSPVHRRRSCARFVSCRLCVCTGFEDWSEVQSHLSHHHQLSAPFSIQRSWEKLALCPLCPLPASSDEQKLLHHLVSSHSPHLLSGRLPPRAVGQFRALLGQCRCFFCRFRGEASVCREHVRNQHPHCLHLLGCVLCPQLGFRHWRELQLHVQQEHLDPGGRALRRHPAIGVCRCCGARLPMGSEPRFKLPRRRHRLLHRLGKLHESSSTLSTTGKDKHHGQTPANDFPVDAHHLANTQTLYSALTGYRVDSTNQNSTVDSDVAVNSNSAPIATEDSGSTVNSEYDPAVISDPGPAIEDSVNSYSASATIADLVSAAIEGSLSASFEGYVPAVGEKTSGESEQVDTDVPQDGGKQDPSVESTVLTETCAHAGSCPSSPLSESDLATNTSISDFSSSSPHLVSQQFYSLSDLLHAAIEEPSLLPSSLEAWSAYLPQMQPRVILTSLNLIQFRPVST